MFGRGCSRSSTARSSSSAFNILIEILTSFAGFGTKGSELLVTVDCAVLIVVLVVIFIVFTTVLGGVVIALLIAFAVATTVSTVDVAVCIDASISPLFGLVNLSMCRTIRCRLTILLLKQSILQFLLVRLVRVKLSNIVDLTAQVQPSKLFSVLELAVGEDNSVPFAGVPSVAVAQLFVVCEPRSPDTQGESHTDLVVVGACLGPRGAGEALAFGLLAALLAFGSSGPSGSLLTLEFGLGRKRRVELTVSSTILGVCIVIVTKKIVVVIVAGWVGGGRLDTFDGVDVGIWVGIGDAIVECKEKDVVGALCSIFGHVVSRELEGCCVVLLEQLVLGLIFVVVVILRRDGELACPSPLAQPAGVVVLDFAVVDERHGSVGIFRDVFTCREIVRHALFAVCGINGTEESDIETRIALGNTVDDATRVVDETDDLVVGGPSLGIWEEVEDLLCFDALFVRVNEAGQWLLGIYERFLDLCKLGLPGNVDALCDFGLVNVLLGVSLLCTEVFGPS